MQIVWLEALMDALCCRNKPANVVEKMVEGRLNKFYGENTLMEQQHMVEEGNPKVCASLQLATSPDLWQTGWRFLEADIQGPWCPTPVDWLLPLQMWDLVECRASVAKFGLNAPPAKRTGLV